MYIAEVTFDSPILAAALERCPDAELTLDAETVLDDGTIQMLVWGEGVAVEEFETAVAADPTVAEGRLLFETDSRWFYSVRLADATRATSVHSLWAERGGCFLDGVGTRKGWTLRMRFPSREAFADFYEACVDRGVDVEIHSLYDSVVEGDGQAFGLTEAQREALSTARERGYFEIPRRSTLDDLAEELDVSDTAVSQRLRRGIDRLLERTDL